MKDVTPVEWFGKAHWDTFRQIEMLCIEHGGDLPLKWKYYNIEHLDDLKTAGLIESRMGEMPRAVDEPTFKMTEKGWQVADELRRYLASGGNIGSFVPLSISSASVVQRAYKWAMGTWTNTASKSIWSVMMGLVEKNTFCDGKKYDVPRNAPEIIGCCSLLIAIPEWKGRFQELVEALPKWKPFVDNWDRIEEIRLDLSKSSDMFPLVWNLAKEGEDWERKTLVDAVAAEHREGPRL